MIYFDYRVEFFLVIVQIVYSHFVVYKSLYLVVESFIDMIEARVNLCIYIILHIRNVQLRKKWSYSVGFISVIV
jgi:hypothetical protein